MPNIFEQILTLLLETSGSMVYHVVVAFIFISLLQPAASLFSNNRGRRLLLGAGSLVLSRLALFAASVTTLLGLPILSKALPVIEVAINAFDILVIIWLFAFPRSKRAGDIGLVLFSLLTFSAAIISVIFWNLQTGATAFNQSGLALGWEFGTLFILLIGLITLLTSKASQRSQGIVMLLILFLGEAAQLLLPIPSGDYLPISRLAQLISFPLLISVVQQYQIKTVLVAQPETSVDLSQLDTLTSEVTAPEVRSKNLDPHLYQNAIALGGATTSQEICRLFTRYTAHALLADICLLLTPPDHNDQVHLICGYDLIVQESLGSISFDQHFIPRFNKVHEGRPIQVIDQGSERMYEFANLLQVDEISNLLAFPIKDKKNKVISVITLISPYSKRVWGAEDQKFLKESLQAIESLMLRVTASSPTDTSKGSDQEIIQQLEHEIQELQTSHADLLKEKEALAAHIDILAGQSVEDSDWLEQLEITKSKDLEPLQASLVVLGDENKALKAENEDALQQISSLTDEKQSLQKALESSASEKQELAATLAETAKENKQLAAALENNADEIELLQKGLSDLAEKNQELNVEFERLREEASNQVMSSEDIEKYAAMENDLEKALTFNAQLARQLDNANEAVLALKDFKTKTNGHGLSSEQNEVIASIAQELRQPMSSISGYTDLLMSESVGILGALQKNFLERVKVSIERMNQLVDDLVNVTMIDSGHFLFNLQPLELIDVIDNAIEATSAQFREKELSLRVDISNGLPKLHTDRDALQQIVLHLLQNAGTATPSDGEITLRAQLYSKTNNDVIMLSVSDTGEGIPQTDLPRVFSRLYRADNPLIQGLGDTGVGLSIAKTLTEALGGRIWVESEQGKGSTFSVLLPTSAPAPPHKAG